MIKYFSYFILIFSILYFLKNNIKNMDYPELMQTILISISIYIIDLVITSNNIKEKITGERCVVNCNCTTGCCISGLCESSTVCKSPSYC